MTVSAAHCGKNIENHETMNDLQRGSTKRIELISSGAPTEPNVITSFLTE